MREFVKKTRRAIANGILSIVEKLTKFDKAIIDNNFATCEITFVDGSSLKSLKFMQTTYVSKAFSMAMIYVMGLKLMGLIGTGED